MFGWFMPGAALCVHEHLLRGRGGAVSMTTRAEARRGVECLPVLWTGPMFYRPGLRARVFLGVRRICPWLHSGRRLCNCTTVSMARAASSWTVMQRCLSVAALMAEVGASNAKGVGPSWSVVVAWLYREHRLQLPLHATTQNLHASYLGIPRALVVWFWPRPARGGVEGGIPRQGHVWLFSLEWWVDDVRIAGRQGPHSAWRRATARLPEFVRPGVPDGFFHILVPCQSAAEYWAGEAYSRAYHAHKVVFRVQGRGGDAAEMDCYALFLTGE
jgi:hypothetical protein